MFVKLFIEFPYHPFMSAGSEVISFISLLTVVMCFFSLFSLEWWWSVLQVFVKEQCFCSIIFFSFQFHWFLFFIISWHCPTWIYFALPFLISSSRSFINNWKTFSFSNISIFTIHFPLRTILTISQTSHFDTVWFCFFYVKVFLTSLEKVLLEPSKFRTALLNF